MKYRYLCIGGPLDGKIVESENPCLKAAETQPRKAYRFRSYADKPESFEIVEYRIERIACDDNIGTYDHQVNEVAFWVDNRLTVMQAICRLADRYRRAEEPCEL